MILDTILYVICLYVFVGFGFFAFYESDDPWYVKLLGWPKYVKAYLTKKFDK